MIFYIITLIVVIGIGIWYFMKKQKKSVAIKRAEPPSPISPPTMPPTETPEETSERFPGI